MSFDAIPEDKAQSFPCEVCNGSIKLSAISGVWECDECGCLPGSKLVELKGRGGLVAEFVLRRAPLTNDVDDGPKNCVHEYADIAVCVHCGVDIDGYSAPENLKAQIRKLERDKASNYAAYMEVLQRDDERIAELEAALQKISIGMPDYYSMEIAKEVLGKEPI